MKKIKSLWDEHKDIICFTGGMILAGFVAVKSYKSFMGTSAVIFKREKVLTFPLSMSIQEIKNILASKNIPFNDALVTIINGETKIFIR